MAKITNSVGKKRIAKGITQEELAEALGVSRQTIVALEKGNYSPSVILALKIAKYFKTSVEEVFKLDV
jgi:putative transcriptional regulator